MVSKKLSNAPVDSSLDKSINRFENLEKKTAEMREKCKKIPNQLQDYKAKFTDLEKWMDAVDVSVERLLKGLLTDEEFEEEKSTFQVNIIFHKYFIDVQHMFKIKFLYIEHLPRCR